jgi:glutaminase
LKQITETSPVQDYLENLHAEFAGISEGSVATYIPELAKADPNWFGICLVTASGAVYEVGTPESRSPSSPFPNPLSTGWPWRNMGGLKS